MKPFRRVVASAALTLSVGVEKCEGILVLQPMQLVDGGSDAETESALLKLCLDFGGVAPGGPIVGGQKTRHHHPV